MCACGSVVMALGALAYRSQKSPGALMVTVPELPGYVLVVSWSVRCPVDWQKETGGGPGLSGLESTSFPQLCKLLSGEAQHRLA